MTSWASAYTKMSFFCFCFILFLSLVSQSHVAAAPSILRHTQDPPPPPFASPPLPPRHGARPALTPRHHDARPTTTPTCPEDTPNAVRKTHHDATRSLQAPPWRHQNIACKNPPTHRNDAPTQRRPTCLVQAPPRGHLLQCACGVQAPPPITTTALTTRMTAARTRTSTPTTRPPTTPTSPTTTRGEQDRRRQR
ncbi:hypothetical protein EDB85DRAFT_392711 [Lactarius pseudohatsudake]|nr:hypothetical protein EDB85DRAFT_392711 [Lactarius pseudohatsudake]